MCSSLEVNACNLDCKNGGKCVTDRKKGSKCKCKKGFSGNTCEKKH